jgi:hypothetical protein
MRERIAYMLSISAAVALLLQGVCFAASPHFLKDPTAALSSANGDLTVSFREVGLGNTPVTYSLSAGTENFTFQCFTKTGNTPQGSPNGESFSNESTETTLTPHNGQIRGSISLIPQVGDASCQGQGLKLCLTAVEYLDVTFQDETNSTPEPPFSLGDFSASGLKICGF